MTGDHQNHTRLRMVLFFVISLGTFSSFVVHVKLFFKLNHFLFLFHASNRYQSQAAHDFFPRNLATSCQNIAHWHGDEMFQSVVLPSTSSQDIIKQRKWKLIPNFHGKLGGQDILMHNGIRPEFQDENQFLQGLLPKKGAVFIHSCLVLLFYTESIVHFHLLFC